LKICKLVAINAPSKESVEFFKISRKIAFFERGLRLTFYLNEIKMLEQNRFQILKADKICNFSSRNKLLFQNFPLPLITR